MPGVNEEKKKELLGLVREIKEILPKLIEEIETGRAQETGPTMGIVQAEPLSATGARVSVIFLPTGLYRGRVNFALR